jgi:ectoine hydroxylase-related dioxygenase (phytanoyl-CoA dioxygenase family)
MDAKTRFDQHGYVFPLDVFSDPQISACRAAFDELEQEFGKEHTQKGIMAKEQKYEFIWKLATDNRLLDAVESVYGNDLVLAGTHFFCKYPVAELGTAYVAWHQDVTYWNLDPPRAMSAWIAIDDVDEENGAMLFIPGSHQHGILEHGQSDQHGNLLSINQALDEGRFDPAGAVTVKLKAGQVSLHDGMLIHGSHPNHSSRRRCGMTVRFMRPDVRIVRKDNQVFTQNAVLVRGKDRFHIQHRAPAPTFGN